MPPRRKKKRKNKYEYEYHQEPICECMYCGLEHLRRQRKKKNIKGEGKFLYIYLCPKCGDETYAFIGDKITKKRVKLNDG
ncbi:MAG: hypothetical protein KAS32_17760 [Candidatus Peribacteraceae bacterium]|nr:hypothetical protein [Candidatus Peribacteraceae bacterium]